MVPIQEQSYLSYTLVRVIFAALSNPLRNFMSKQKEFIETNESVMKG